MSTVVVRGLDGEGPGDVVGAFVNEAGVAPDEIGDIEIEGPEATVELADGRADTVTEGDVFEAFVANARDRGADLELS